MKLSEKMTRACFERNTKDVLLMNLNFTNIENYEDASELYAYAITFAHKMPKRSMMLLFDLRGLIANANVEDLLKQMTIESSKYFSASAIVVDSKSEEIMKSMAKELGLSKMITYYDIEAAKNQLVNANCKNF